MATFPLPLIAEGTAIPGSESIADKYFAPEINKIIEALNEVEARVKKIEPPLTPTTSVIVDLTDAQADLVFSVPIGGTFVFRRSSGATSTILRES